jgi:hypothetical protein
MLASQVGCEVAGWFQREPIREPAVRDPDVIADNHPFGSQSGHIPGCQ